VGRRKSSASRATPPRPTAKEVVAADFEQPGDNDVVHKVTRDLAGKGVTEAQLRAKMTNCWRRRS